MAKPLLKEAVVAAAFDAVRRSALNIADAVIWLHRAQPYLRDPRYYYLMLDLLGEADKNLKEVERILRSL